MDHYVSTEELPTLGFTPDADFPAIFAEKGILQISFSGKSSDRFRALAGEAINMVPSICTFHDLIASTSVITRGVSAHASTPDQGVNAITEAISALPDDLVEKEPLLAFIKKYFLVISPSDSLITSISADISGSITINPAILLMDEYVSSVTLDIRYPVLGDFDHLLQELTGKAAVFGLIPSINSHLKPLHLPTDSPLITTLLSVYEKYLDSFYCADKSSEMYIQAINRPVRPIAIGGGTYARSMPGIVAFGPSLPWETCQMHQPNESVHEETLIKLVSLYADAITCLCEIIN
jgi:succinyl-diaminopimelate desuccinylase